VLKELRVQLVHKEQDQQVLKDFRVSLELKDLKVHQVLKVHKELKVILV
tara:strand:- start:274 stop:420 length:147 start_codon:yes stop_codon:yes gene_type:complete